MELSVVLARSETLPVRSEVVRTRKKFFNRILRYIARTAAMQGQSVGIGPTFRQQVPCNPSRTALLILHGVTQRKMFRQSMSLLERQYIAGLLLLNLC